MKRKQITIIGVVISVLIITVIVMAVNLDRSAIIETILTGVVSSILASIVFYVFSKDVFQDNSDEKEKLDKAIEKTREIYGFALNSQLGILKIEKRSGYNTDFWRKFLQGTKNRCIISGRTLNRWLKKEIRDEFIETLKRLIKNNGEIVFVIYKISEGLKEKEEKENLKKFLNKEIFPYIYKKEKSHSRKSWEGSKYIRIYEVDVLHYLYTANDDTVVVAPYFQYNSNIENIMFSLDTNSLFGTMYSNDFEQIIKNKTQENEWYKEFAEKRRKKK